MKEIKSISDLAQANNRKREGKRRDLAFLPLKGSDVDRDTIGRKQKPEATKANQKRVVDLNKVVVEEVEVDPTHRAFFFQRRAQLIKKISEENGGVNITFPRAGSNSSRVLLKGAKKFVSTAKIAIMEVVTDLESRVTVECLIPRKHHGKVIGPKGVNVEALCQEHSVSIKFPDRAANSAAGVQTGTSNSDLDVIFIRGKEENCLMVREALLELVPVNIAIEVPFRFHRSIIGQGGENVRSMSGQYEVWIHIPPPELEKNFVYVEGLARNCEKAKEALLKHVKELKDEAEDRELRSHRETVQVKPK